MISAIIDTIFFFIPRFHYFVWAGFKSIRARSSLATLSLSSAIWIHRQGSIVPILRPKAFTPVGCAGVKTIVHVYTPALEQFLWIPEFLQHLPQPLSKIVKSKCQKLPEFKTWQFILWQFILWQLAPKFKLLEYCQSCCSR